MKSKFLKMAIKAVKNAERVILKYYNHNQHMKLKSDRTPVTIADKEAEQIIIKTIKKAFPEHGFLGEEFGQAKTKTGYVWIIDPIDGTKSYTRHIPLFGTLLALAKDGEIILGVSNVPLQKELMYAEKGKGAFLNGKRVRTSFVKKLSEASMSHGNIVGFLEEHRHEDLLKISTKFRSCRDIMDLWAYHLLAQGKIDAVVEAKIKIWDIAPAVIIVQEAGGKVTDFRGRPVDLNSTDIVATNSRLHKTILAYFKR